MIRHCFAINSDCTILLEFLNTTERTCFLEGGANMRYGYIAINRRDIESNLRHARRHGHVYTATAEGCQLPIFVYDIER